MSIFFSGVPTFVAALSSSRTLPAKFRAYRSGRGHSLYPFNVLDPLWHPYRILCEGAPILYNRPAWGGTFRYQGPRGFRREGKGGISCHSFDKLATNRGQVPGIHFRKKKIESVSRLAH
ncbi:hypothetical protein AOQ84DRAFT_120287 [Glonium stellatum]|uniref:Uncharacterized protein n=1 Tax=Glonium stellatum TaxID=574774 RepID=A0A8E2ETZ7_9PEZI|nr:hypothetical protein AOQ84DRAFT_120287 [Glonium stellatum]